MNLRLAVADLVTATGGQVLVPPGTPVPAVVTGVTTDSRTATPGELFVALRGPHTDGHRFVADAEARGAVLAMIADPAAARGPALIVADPLRALGTIAALHRRTLATTVIGITGSVGKTTAVALTATVLAERFVAARSAESWNAELGVALTLLGLGPAHQIAVIEMAMRGVGQLRELVEMARPRIGAVTNIGDTHLELLGSRENIAAAKAELLEGLPPDGAAVVNVDEALTARLTRDVRCRVVTVGLTPQANVRATEITRANGGFTFSLHLDGQRDRAYLPLAGSHQVRNALIAAAVGQVMGLGLQEIVTGLSHVHAVKMRQELHTLGDILLIDDSYNASPQSMAAAFEVVAQVGGRRRRVLVLGEMRELGPRSPDFHHRVGQEAAELSPAFLLAVGPTAQWYTDGAAAAGLPAAAMAHAASPEDAVPILQGILRAGDVLLIKGSRAIEMERVVHALRLGAAVGHS